MIKFEDYTYEQLKKLSADLAAEMERRHADEISKARSEIQSIAARVGYSVSELLEMKGAAAKKAPLPAMYQSPVDPTLQWSGRGRPPAWFKEAIAKGADESQLRVK